MGRSSQRVSASAGDSGSLGRGAHFGVTLNHGLYVSFAKIPNLGELLRVERRITFSHVFHGIIEPLALMLGICAHHLAMQDVTEQLVSRLIKCRQLRTPSECLSGRIVSGVGRWRKPLFPNLFGRLPVDFVSCDRAIGGT